jgi:hypothetical protein
MMEWVKKPSHAPVPLNSICLPGPSTQFLLLLFNTLLDGNLFKKKNSARNCSMVT